jgi:hypothetical protein
MNRALERGPLSVARSRLYRSGQRLDPFVGSGTVDGDSQVSWQHDERILSRLSRRGSNGACTTMLAVLPAVEHPLPACTQGPIRSRMGLPGRIMSSLHAASRTGEPNERSAWVQ